MKMTVAWLALVMALPLSAQAAEAPSLSFKEISDLSHSLTRSLRKCKRLRSRPEVSVEVQNETTASVDKAQLAELIHCIFEGKSHAKAEAKEPNFKILAKLSSSSRTTPLGSELLYSLSAEVQQANEKLCEKSATLSKLSK